MMRAAFFGAGVIGLGLAGAIVWFSPEPMASARPVPTGVASVASVATAPSSVLVDSNPPLGAATADDAGAGPTMIGFDRMDASALGELPPLTVPSSSTKGVHFGLVLVRHSGSQGAGPGARSKADAQALAARLAGQAQSDFKGAVAAGDQGSAEDLGRMDRGVLEPETESVLFTLDPGAVSAPIDTPTGFWIVKRLD